MWQALHKSRALCVLNTLIEVDHVVGSMYFTHLGIRIALLKCSKLLKLSMGTLAVRIGLYLNNGAIVHAY